MTKPVLDFGILESNTPLFVISEPVAASLMGGACKTSSGNENAVETPLNVQEGIQLNLCNYWMRCLIMGRIP